MNIHYLRHVSYDMFHLRGLAVWSRSCKPAGTNCPVRISTKTSCCLLLRTLIGLQFHLETTPELARALINNSADELDGSRYVQTEKEMLANPQRFSRINQIMSEVLDALEKRTRT
jgi:hypothetical protein